MTAVLCGLLTAGCWATSTLLIAGVARRSESHELSFAFLLAGVLMLAVPAAIALPRATITGGEVAATTAAGLAGAGGILLYGRAARHGDLSVLSPIMSLEGAFAAAFALLLGATVAPLVGIGLLLALLGTVVTAAAPRDADWLRPGSALALGAALLFGAMLWLLTNGPKEPVVALFLARVCSVLALAPFVRRPTLPRAAVGRLALAALADVVGYGAFLLGSEDSVVVTAVLAAQFGVLGVLAGCVLWHERLVRRQVLGVALITVGVGTVTGAAS